LRANAIRINFIQLESTNQIYNIFDNNNNQINEGKNRHRHTFHFFLYKLYNMLTIILYKFSLIEIAKKSNTYK
jgi:hypothetical protein